MDGRTPKILAARKNPTPRGADQGKLDQAARLLENFSGHDPGKVVETSTREFREGLVVGDLDGVMYTATRDGRREKYLHEFRRKSRPRLAVSHDGKQLGIVGGRYLFTDAGITDK